MKKNLKDYLLTLHDAKNIEKTVESNLDDTTLMILNFIAVNPSSSIYDCYKYLNNNNGMTIAYKNVHIKVHNLIKLGLIQKVRNPIKKENEKSSEYEDFFISNSKNSSIYYSISPTSLFYFSSIYYSISSAGLFYLFKTNLVKVDKQLILKNKDDGIFKTLLYPYLDLETLEKVHSKRLLGKIFSYFNKCCDTIRGQLTILHGVEERGGELYFLAVTGELIDPEYDNDVYGSKQFIEYLKNKFNIKWLDVNNTKIIEVDKSRLFKICDEKKNELLFELYPERHIAILSERNHKIDDFDIEEWSAGDYNVRHFNPFMVEDYIEAQFDAKKKILYFK